MITVLIPAYDNLSTLVRALNSLSAQSIASKITVIISDDCPSKPLSKTALANFADSFYELKIFYQSLNQGVLSNKYFLFTQVDTQYFSFLEHDDWIHDDHFFENACFSLNNQDDAAFYFGNSIVSTSLKPDNNYNPKDLMYSIPTQSFLSSKEYCDNWPISGSEFLKRLTNSSEACPFNTSWSAVIFRTKHVRQLGGFATHYVLTFAEAQALNVYREEEHFAILFLLACKYMVLVETKLSVVRGIELTSFSRSPSHPGRSMLQDSAFYAFYKAAYFIDNILDSKNSSVAISCLYKLSLRIGLTYPTYFTECFLEAYKPKSSHHAWLANHLIQRLAS